MLWRLAIDTGGTFTDCLATPPDGPTRRVKVLSSSAIRARVVARPDPRTITTAWDIPAHTLAGCTLAPLDATSLLPHAFPSIIHHDTAAITLSAPLDLKLLPPGSVFEVRSPWQPPILAARIATATPAHAALPPIHMRLATTRGTNALLERRGHPPALFITRGFADLLDIGDQTRPDLFALRIVKPEPLHATSVEVTERLAVDGSVLTTLDLDELRPRAIAALGADLDVGDAGHWGHPAPSRRSGETFAADDVVPRTTAPRPAAVAFMHSWRNPAHELAVAAMLRQIGFTHVCTSASLSPLIGFLSRTQSAVVNAYLSRVVGDYLAGVESDLGPGSQLLVMTSAGGLCRAADFHPKDSLLSGPAGGLLGAADAARHASEASRPPPPRAGEVPTSLGDVGGGRTSAAQLSRPSGTDAIRNSTPPTPLSRRFAEPTCEEAANFDRLLTFDMGGTSTDVARCTSAARREFPLTREHRVAHARILAPAVAVESVAAGGGSICSFHNGELRVGPESAGAHPGPACYGAGGPLTITDCHLLLGRLAPARFPVPLDTQAARAAAQRVLEHVNTVSGASATQANQPPVRSASDRRRGSKPPDRPEADHGPRGADESQRPASSSRASSIPPQSPPEANADPGAEAPSYLHAPSGRRPLAPTPATAPFASGLAVSPALTLESLLEGFLTLADERMADAIRRISIRQGEDPTSYTLLAFGGAGGLHACALAEQLSISTVLIPPDAGLLSARGLSVATIQRTAQRQVLWGFDDDAGDQPPTPAGGSDPIPPRERGGWLHDALAELARHAADAVAREGIAPDRIRISRREAAVRVQGQSATLDIPADDIARIPARFADAYVRTFGHAPPPRPLEIESLLVVASSPPPPRAAEVPARLGEAGGGGTCARSRLFTGGAWLDAPILTRDSLGPSPVPGPALLADTHATTFIPPGWSASGTPSGAVTLARSPTARVDSPNPQSFLAARDRSGPSPASPIALELFIASLTAIAHDMGEMLRRTALSVNVKERLDFSCALLSPDGQLLVNAPHIPVHLGALGLCVRALQAAIEMDPGDTIITNHPAYGGSHLPDITLVTPIHLDAPDGPLLIGYAASRAHHAEIGGIKPGSMPPGATRLSQEGVILPPTHLVRAGVERFDQIARTLTTAPHPTRAPEHNLADLRAALAANMQGHRAMRALFTRTGRDASHAHCRALTDRAESRVRAALARITPGIYRSTDALDDGSPIAVTITIPTRATTRATSPAATIDFTGTAPIHPQNFNATPAITTAAALYVLRLLVNEPMPLNEGMLRAIDLLLPEGTLINPGDAWTAADGPAVAAGNVETSQRLVDVLLLALNLAAASQGTMNNLAFGDATFGFYETICGGSGATPHAPGASAVHTHMTNTRITDAEILEQRLPVRVRRFQVRPGSGGPGLHPGGDGVIREVEFLTPVDCSVLAQRRSSAPPGLAGGLAGMPGRTLITLPGADPTELLASSPTEMPSGTIITVETPGGGGFGLPAASA